MPKNDRESDNPMNILHINPLHPFRPLYARMLEAFNPLHTHHVYAPVVVGRTIPPSDVAPHLADRVVYSRDYRQWERVLYHRKVRRIMTQLTERMEVPQYDLIHGHFLFSTGGVALALKRTHGIPYVVSVQSSDIHTFFRFGWHLRGQARRIMGEAEKIIFINPSLRDVVLRRYVHADDRAAIEKKSHVIPYGIDPFWLDNPDDAPSVPTDNRVALLFVGEWKVNKNIPATVEAARILKRQGYDVRLDLVGDGWQRDRIQKLVRDLPYVHVHGHVSAPAALLGHYRRSHVLVVPSFRETFGLVYGEALSQGVPVIYSRGQGIDGYFPDGAVGYAVNPRDPRMIAQRITDLLSDYRSISARGQEAARTFAWPAITTRLEELYHEARRIGVH